VAWPLAARAQQPVMPGVGFLDPTSLDSSGDILRAFRQGLKDTGYVEGENVAIVYRFAENQFDRLPELAAELVRRRVAVIATFASGTLAAKAATTTIPIVVATSADAVASGLVESLARPGGNFTGSTFLSLDLAGKRIDLLKDIFPQLRTLAVLSNTDHPGERSEWQTTQRAAQALGIDPVYVPFFGARELDNALTVAGNARADAILVFPEGATMVHRTKIARFAVEQRLPSMFGWSEYCDAGGLLSYGANQRATYFRLATYADRVLRGENPSDLPVEQPTKFELVLNLKTAKVLRIDVTTSILLRADKVIE